MIGVERLCGTHLPLGQVAREKRTVDTADMPAIETEEEVFVAVRDGRIGVGRDDRAAGRENQRLLAQQVQQRSALQTAEA